MMDEQTLKEALDDYTALNERNREKIRALTETARKYRSALLELFDSANMIGGNPGKYIEEIAGKALGLRQ